MGFRCKTCRNSFFWQLDHIITTLCNEDFSLLYALTAAQLETESNNDDDEGGGASDDTNATANANADTNSTTTTTTEQQLNPLTPPPSKELVKQYSNLKASIFYGKLGLAVPESKQPPINATITYI